MFYVQELSMVKSAGEDSYTINSNSRLEMESIMDRIYKENPSYWPDGLSISGHENLYMIRSASTNEPAGFVGWQTRKEANTKVGYYTIGILPEFRRNGYAKAAVSKLIEKKANEVDTVRAYIVPHNYASRSLANKLNIPIVKEASQFAKNRTLTGTIAGALGNTALWDWAANEHQPWEGEYWQGFGKHRLTMGAINALLGAAGGGMMGKGLSDMTSANAPALIGGGAGTIALSPVKDWVTQSLPAAHKVPEMVDNLSKGGMSPAERIALMGMGGLGLAGISYGGYKTLKALKDLVDTEKARGGGRMQVTLPTKDPDDRETVIDIPFHEVGVSQTAKGKLRRDLRRRVNAEVKERTRSRTPSRKKKKDEDKEKSASILPDRNASMDRIKALIDTLYG